jgi:hypothetical protein
LGWSNDTSSVDSRWKRRTAFSSFASDGCMILSATLRLFRRSSARNTVAVPPTPSFPLIRIPGIGSLGLGFGGGCVGIRCVPGLAPATVGIRWVDGLGAPAGGGRGSRLDPEDLLGARRDDPDLLGSQEPVREDDLLDALPGSVSGLLVEFRERFRRLLVREEAVLRSDRHEGHFEVGHGVQRFYACPRLEVNA